MKFCYSFRTSDNQLHEGIVAAANRDAAYAELKAKGIRPSRLAEAPGVLNKVLGKGKRWIAIGVLGLAVVSAVLVIKANHRTIRTIREAESQPLPRQQIYGDPSILQQLDSEKWSSVFADPCDRMLSQFARPGLPVTTLVPNAGVVRLDPLPILDSDPEEVRKMKRIVNGMKAELSSYLKDGGTFDGYVERLQERQRVEQAIISDALVEFGLLRRMGARESSRDAAVEKWLQKNQLLRDMGMKPVPMPENW